ncbi:hypothetical protein Ciccas_012448, partial [Cichlidogyrus casuarinus]
MIALVANNQGETWKNLFASYQLSLVDFADYGFIKTSKYVQSQFDEIALQVLLKTKTGNGSFYALNFADPPILDLKSWKIFQNIELDQKKDLGFKAGLGLRCLLEGLPLHEQSAVLSSVIKAVCNGTETLNKSRNYISDGLADYMVLNSTKRQPDSSALHHRYAATNATPRAIFNSFRVYMESRSLREIDILHKEGIGISSSSTLRIASSLLETLQTFDARIPLNLHRGVFTVFGFDNIDKKQFHGSLQICAQVVVSGSVLEDPPAMQAVKRVLRGQSIEDHQDLDTETELLNSSIETLDERMNVIEKEEPSSSRILAEPPLPVMRDATFKPVFIDLTVQFRVWLFEHSQESNNPLKYFAVLQNSHPTPKKSVIGVFPLFRQRPCLDSVVKFMYNSFICHKQICPSFPFVVGADQPVCALAYKVAWSFQEFAETHPDFSLSLSRVICIPGLLHQQFALMKCIGILLRGSGLLEIAREAQLLTQLQVSKYEDGSVHAREMRNLLTALLVGLDAERKTVYSASQTLIPYPDWLAEQEATNQDYIFVRRFEELVYCLFSLYIGIRLENFDDPTLPNVNDALVNATCYYFAMDRINYSRITATFLCMMNYLKSREPDTYQSAKKGLFLHLTSADSSAVSLDFAVEHVVRIMKNRFKTINLQRDVETESDIRFFKIQPIWESVADIGWEQNTNSHKHHSEQQAQKAKLARQIDFLTKGIHKAACNSGFLQRKNAVLKNANTGESRADFFKKLETFRDIGLESFNRIPSCEEEDRFKFWTPIKSHKIFSQKPLKISTQKEAPNAKIRAFPIEKIGDEEIFPQPSALYNWDGTPYADRKEDAAFAEYLLKQRNPTIFQANSCVIDIQFVLNKTGQWKEKCPNTLRTVCEKKLNSFFAQLRINFQKVFVVHPGAAWQEGREGWWSTIEAFCDNTPVRGSLLDAISSPKQGCSLFNYILNRYDLMFTDKFKVSKDQIFAEFLDEIGISDLNSTIFCLSNLENLVVAVEKFKELGILQRGQILFSYEIDMPNFHKSFKCDFVDIDAKFGDNLHIVDLAHALSGGMHSSPQFKLIGKKILAAKMLDGNIKTFKNFCQGLEDERF